MPESIEEILEICIDKMKNESLTVEECIAEFPQYQNELEEMLPLVASVSSLKQIKPSNQFSWHAANRITAKLPDAPVTFWERIRHTFQKEIFIKDRSIKMPQIIVSIIIALSLMFGGSYAVEAAGPGDLLYDLDRGVEQIRLKLTSDPVKVLELKMQIASERLEEAYNKLMKGDVDNALRALEQYNKNIEEINAYEDGQVREETRTMTQEEGAMQAGTLLRLRESQPEDAQARNAFQKALQRANMGLEQLFGPPEEAPQGPSEDVPQGPNSEDAQGPTEDAPMGPNEEAPQGPTDNAPKGPSNGKP